MAPQRHPSVAGQAAIIVAALLIVATAAVFVIRGWDSSGLRGPERAWVAHGRAVSGLAFSPNGRQLASGSWDKTAKLWDVASGRPVRTLAGPKAGLNDISFSPDGTTLAAGSEDTTVTLWDARTGRALRPRLFHHSYAIAAVFSPDGRLLVTTGHADKTAKVWDARTRTLRAKLTGHEGWAGAAAFSPDGARLVTADKGGAREWDVATGKLLRRLPGPPVHWIAFSPDGTTLLCGGAYGPVVLRDARTLRPTHTLARAGAVHAVAWASNGRRFVTGGDMGLHLWDAQTGRLEQTLPPRALLHRLPTGVVRYLPAGLRPAPPARVVALAVSPDGRRVAAGDPSGKITLWRLPRR